MPVIPLLNLLVVVFVGAVLITFAFNNRALLQRQDDQSIRDACAIASIVKFPEALSRPEELRKYIAYNEACARLNNVPTHPHVDLP